MSQDLTAVSTVEGPSPSVSSVPLPTATRYPTGWAAVADLVVALGVDTIFGLPGDDMGPLAALATLPVRVVLCRDQRNAVFMATGYALSTGYPGVVIVGKGPAVTNTITGLLEADSARVPLLLVAAGTAEASVGTGAFQEVDQLTLVRPLTRYAARVTEPSRLGAVLNKAALIARAVPGPVYVEISEPVGLGPVTVAGPWRAAPVEPSPASDESIATSGALLARAQRPVLLAGGGCRHRDVGRIIEQLAEALGAPIFATASGRGVPSEEHDFFCGLAGLYSVPAMSELWAEADLVVALGSRLEETATFGWPQSTRVIQVTLDAADVATEREGSAVLGDVRAALLGWLDADTGPYRSAWVDRVRTTRAAAERVADGIRKRDRPNGVAVTAVLSVLDRVVPPDRILVQENGLQDMWSYFFPYWSSGSAGGSIVPSEQTSLGFGAAAAVGVACGRKGPVVSIAGDGAFHLFRSELPTVVEAGVGVLYVVLDNGGYGWLQKNLGAAVPGSRYRFTDTGRGTGNRGLAAAYGLGFARIDDVDDLEPVLREVWRECAAGRTTIVEIGVDLDDTPPGIDKLAGDFPVSPHA